jgi:hypothetical protein
MKRLLISICVLSLVFVCKESVAQQKVKMKEDKVKMKDDKGKMKAKGMEMDNTSYPYTAGYSSNFRIGDPANSKMILEMWKDYDDNTFDNHDYVADTAVMFFADGTMARGKDSLLMGVKQYRGSLSNVSSTLDAWVPLRSVDRNENWVALWGTETHTTADGKVEKKDIHEIWRINKDGKVDFMKQFMATPTMAPMQQ